MKNSWAPLQAVLNEGSEARLDDQAIWQSPIDEFGMDVKITRPLSARLQILPQEDGLLVRGRITGAVSLPCNLCTEEALVEIKHEFDSFEPFPVDPDSGAEPDPDVDEYFIRFAPQGTGLEINLAALAWEEFVEALPQYPLCREGCAGLCPSCGQNLNQGRCSCTHENYDPRLEKLRGLKLNK